MLQKTTIKKVVEIITLYFIKPNIFLVKNI